MIPCIELQLSITITPQIWLFVDVKRLVGNVLKVESPILGYRRYGLLTCPTNVGIQNPYLGHEGG